MATTRMAGSLLAATMNRLGARVAPAIGSAVGDYLGGQTAQAVSPLIEQAAEHVAAPGIAGRTAQAIATLSPEKIGRYTGRAAQTGAELATAAGVDIAKDYIINQQNPPQISRSQQQHYNRLFMSTLPPGTAYENAEPIMYPSRQAIPSWLPGALGAAGMGAAAVAAGRR